MLTIVAKITAKEDKIALVKSELIKLIAPTKKEEGCINYDLHHDNEQKNIFLFYENWQTRDLWLKHMDAHHIANYKIATADAVESFTLNEMTLID